MNVTTTPAMTFATPRRLRMWPAILALYFLSPICGEMISGSTPPLIFIQPFALVFLPLLYGSSAILIREIVARRALGWGNVLLLGAAFGVLQEALVVQTWFNYVASSSPSHTYGGYGAIAGTNWYWALALMIYHAVVSISVPLILIDLFFPLRAGRPWLGRKGAIALVAWLVIPCALLAFYVARTQFVKQGYHGPPVSGYVAAIAIMVALVVLGASLRFPAPRPDLDRPSPLLWTVRLTYLGLSLLFFVVAVVLTNAHAPAWVASLMEVAGLGFGVWRARWGSARAGWGASHRLAVAVGVLAFYIFIWGPLFEFAIRLLGREGLTLVNLLILAGLALFARQIKQRTAHPPPARWKWPRERDEADADRWACLNGIARRQAARQT